MNEKGKLLSITVNVGVGKVNKDQKLLTAIQQNLGLITGQKPVERRASKAIAGFKLKKGDLVGFVVTLRGKRMKDFLTRLTKLALPANRDFRGIAQTSIDQSGNLTIGIPDMTIFPELHDQSGSFQYGLQVTLVSNRLGHDSKIFYEGLGIPFRKG